MYPARHARPRARRRVAVAAAGCLIAGGTGLAVAGAGAAQASTSGCTSLGVSCGTNVNVFGNAWDVKGQVAKANNLIIAWPNSTSDRATDFHRTGAGPWFYEYSPNGHGTTLCVSDPDGGYAADPGGRDGLVLRSCNNSIFQEFKDSTVTGPGGHQLVNAASGKPVQTNGTGHQLTGGGSYAGGSFWTWKGGNLTAPPPPVTNACTGSPVPCATVTAKLTGRPDSGNSGYWASDAITRTVTVWRGNQAPLGDCIGAASGDVCYWYHGKVSDTGTFTTLNGALSPEAGTAIQGQVSGDLKGSGDYSFYASSAAPSASGAVTSADNKCTSSSTPADCAADAAAIPAGQTTGTWVKQFFPAGTHYGPDLQPGQSALQDTWGWTYSTTSACVVPVQTWVNAAAGDSGDILGHVGC